MEKEVSGYCPVAEQKLTISVEYIYSESFQERIWVKDKAVCPIADSVLCSVDSCPLKKSLPQNLPF